MLIKSKLQHASFNASCTPERIVTISQTSLAQVTTCESSTERAKKNETVEWIAATVVAAHQHYLEVRRTARGRPMRVAYEDVRFKPKGTLATELLSCSLEEELAKPMATQDETTDTVPATDATATMMPDNPPPQRSDNKSVTPRQPSLLATSQNQDTPQPLATTNRPERGERDVGTYAVNIQNDSTDINGSELQRDISRELENIYEVVGSKQVTATKLSFAPPFVLQHALKQ